MSFRSNYWSCTKFANEIRKFSGMPVKLTAGTSEEWRDWEILCARDYPKTFWVTDTVLDKIQNFIMFPVDRINDFRSYIVNRYIDKMHFIPTRLKKGDYFEIDTRILHGLFETLVDFIECEKAWMMVVFDDEKFKLYQYPEIQKYRLLRWTRKFRCPQAGLDYLNWEINLIDDLHSKQSDSAKEQLALYDWWKNVRPLRLDPFEMSGLSEFWESREKIDGFLSFMNQPDTPDYNLMRDLSSDIEESFEREDEEMMIRLIKIRKQLWT